MKFKGVSDRLVHLITAIDKTTSLQIIQVYVLAISYHEEKVEKLY